MIRQLLEAINVPDAQFIGSHNGFDLFDIRTFQAAQQFETENGDPAGTVHTQSEATFNANITDTVRLYFFTHADTNVVAAAVLKSNTTRSTITFEGNDGARIALECNFEYERANSAANIIPAGLNLPLLLIPEVSVQDSFDDGLIIINHEIKALLPHLSENSIIDLTVPEFVTNIDSNAFNYGLPVANITINGQHTSQMAPYAMNGVRDNIFVTDFTKPEDWDDLWNAGKADITRFGANRSEEEIAAYIQEQEAQARAEQERLDREREEAERVEREAAEREARKLRYKVEGKNITIKGTIPGVSELRIPGEIQGKPVTKIESYAFYDNDELEQITLPSSMKLIEQGAFMDCVNLRHSVYVPKDCIVGPNAFRNTPYQYRRASV